MECHFSLPNMETCLLIIQIFILIVLLAFINFGWWRVEKLRKKYEEAQIEELRRKKTEKNERFTEEELKDEIEPKSLHTWARAIAICLNIWIVGAIVTHVWSHFFFEEISGSSKQALFGDSFGAVNALISAFAFAGMLVAFFLQRYELRLQRKELQLTRDEMSDQTKQFVLQNKTLQIQRFESTFFHMMELQQQIVNELSANQTEEIRKDLWNGPVSFSKDFPIDQNISGRNLFFHAFCNIIHEFPDNDPNEVEKLRGMREVLEKKGFSYYEEMATPTYFDHYFRHLYTILRFIDKEDKKDGDNRLFSEEELYGYAKILRATLSRYELVWLYYNGLSDYGKDKLKPLIERYCLLKNLREDLLACSKENNKVLVDHGLTIKDIEKEKFIGTDYEFYLTSEPDDKTKYHISAFYNTFQEQAEARALVNRWNSFLDSKRKTKN